MRKLLLILVVLGALLAIPAAPALAGIDPIIQVDWGTAVNWYGYGYSLGARVLVSDSDSLFPVYADFNLDYDGYYSTISIGSVVRGPNLIFLHPYAGAGYSYYLDEYGVYGPAIPYVLCGVDVMWWYVEAQMTIYDGYFDYIARAGFRIGF